MKPGRRVSAASIVLCLVLTGCSDSTRPRLDDILDLIGVYRLETIEGAPLPGLVYQDATVTTLITEGTLELNPDFRFKQNYVVQHSQGEQQSEDRIDSQGVFSRNETEVILQHPSGIREVARFEGDLITLTTNDGLVFVFRNADL